MTPSRERGSATVVIVCAIAVVMVATGTALAVGSVTIARHRAAAAADAAALAAALTAINGPDAACRRGAVIASRNGARLTSCTVEDSIAEVRVEVILPGVLRRFGPAVGRARAGPAGVG